VTASRSLVKTSRGFVALLLGVVLPSIGALGWLGVAQLRQERTLVAQRDLERRQALASTIARDLDAQLVAAESEFVATILAPGVVRLRVSARGVTVEPRTAAAWIPLAGDGTQGGRDAQDLIALARSHRLARRWEAAIEAYRALGALGDVSVLGAPADLQARRWTADVLRDAGRARDASVEAASLAGDLSKGRWLLDRATWGFVTTDLREEHGQIVRPVPERLLVAEVADELWRDMRRGLTGGISRRYFSSSDAAAVILSRPSDDGVNAVVLESDYIAQRLRDATSQPGRHRANVSITSESGQLLAGVPAGAAASLVTLTSTDTGLPFRIVLAPGDTSDLAAESATRNRLVLLGIVLPIGLLLTGVALAWRVMRRELALSRLKSEFVAAVSHEFRTPLASLRHVTELLQEQTAVPEDERRQFYEALARNTQRLNRLVESLLDLSRVESGKKVYDMCPLDPVGLVRNVVHDFRPVADAARARLRLEQRGQPPPVAADAGSLAIAAWNLLDNAVKYSPAPADVVVGVGEDRGTVAISVRDCGIGIPISERRTVFERFVRGTDARRLGVKGTGLGLALVVHIVEAHGGSIELQSEVGAGSVFTIRLPALPGIQAGGARPRLTEEASG
jgi:signal transduction histidine kinase